MKSPQPMERGLIAPETLGLDTRVEVRKAAFDLLDQMPEGAGRLVLDLSRTTQIDSAGLGVLMLIQHRAAERRQVVALRNVGEEIRFLLVLTKLVELFELESPVG
jgi:anti-anti-sigma factor